MRSPAAIFWRISPTAGPQPSLDLAQVRVGDAAISDRRRSDRRAHLALLADEIRRDLSSGRGSLSPGRPPVAFASARRSSPRRSSRPCHPLRRGYPSPGSKPEGSSRSEDKSESTLAAPLLYRSMIASCQQVDAARELTALACRQARLVIAPFARQARQFGVGECAPDWRPGARLASSTALGELAVAGSAR